MEYNEGGERVIPIVSIVGWSNSGKTSFITKLIPELKSRGYKVATIKHNAHKFEIDKETKDSWKHREAGAETVVLSSAEKVAMIKEIKTEINLKKLVNDYIDDSFDLVIVEGNKNGDLPKIEVFRPDLYEEPVAAKDKLLARVINDNDREELFAQAEEIAGKIISKMSDFSK
jgi:molybdopterin-guanine dinucleotide biosynthesis protein B